MQVENLPLDGLKLITPKIFEDKRGFFLETWQANRYADIGLPEFVQDNHSRSIVGTLRGLHFTINRPQAQLVYVTVGEIFDVAVDLRSGSPTFGQWYGAYLSGENHKQLFMPAGFAHGFLVTEGTADVHYKVTEFYFSDDEGGINWADTALAIDWPGVEYNVSPRDSAFPTMVQLTSDNLPQINFKV